MTKEQPIITQNKMFLNVQDFKCPTCNRMFSTLAGYNSHKHKKSPLESLIATEEESRVLDDVAMITELQRFKKELSKLTHEVDNMIYKYSRRLK